MRVVGLLILIVVTGVKAQGEEGSGSEDLPAGSGDSPEGSGDSEDSGEGNPGSSAPREEDYFAECINGTELDQSFCLPKAYRRLAKPEEQVNVSLSFSVNKILEISDQKQTLTIVVKMVMAWIDDRFTVAKLPWWKGKVPSENDSLPLGGETIEQVSRVPTGSL